MPDLTNTIMYWHDGTQFKRVSDHNRTELSEDIERIERKQRMADGTLRRYTVAKKRTWSASWEMLPSVNTGGGMATADGGMSGSEMESFNTNNDGAFQMQLRTGAGVITTVTVMIAEFTKSVVRRGPRADLWNLSITLEEV